MKIKTIKIFTKHAGLETLTREEFLDNLDHGLYDGVTIEIVEAER